MLLVSLRKPGKAETDFVQNQQGNHRYSHCSKSNYGMRILQIFYCDSQFYFQQNPLKDTCSFWKCIFGKTSTWEKTQCHVRNSSAIKFWNALRRWFGDHYHIGKELGKCNLLVFLLFLSWCSNGGFSIVLTSVLFWNFFLCISSNHSPVTPCRPVSDFFLSRSFLERRKKINTIYF